MKKIIPFLVMASAFCFAQAEVTAPLKATCNSSGEYVREDTLKDAVSQVLVIKGKSASVFNQRVTRNGNGQLKLIGQKEHADRFVLKNSRLDKNIEWFDLAPIRLGGGYFGFAYDCKDRSLFHPSIGDWIRI